MNLNRCFMVTLVALALSAPAPAQTTIKWETDLESALKKAKEKGKPLLISMHTSTEVACQRMLQNLYTDPEIIAILSEFILLPTCFDVHEEVTKTVDGKSKKVSPLFGTVGCAELTKNEAAVRERFFDSSDVKVPQHIFVGDDGSSYITKIYELKKPAFITLLNNALIVYGSKAADGMDSVTRGFLKSVKSGKTKESRRGVRGIVEFEDQRKLDILYLTIQSIKKEKAKGECVRAMGYERYAWAAPTVKKWLRDSSEYVRNCAVVTLEEMKATEACDELLKLWKKAKDKELKKDILRALGPCGGGVDAVKKILVKNVKHRKEDMRIACYLSLGYYLDQKEIQDLLAKQYKKEGKSVAAKTAIVWAYTCLRDEELIAPMNKLIEKEKNKQVHYMAEVAALRIKTGSGVAQGAPIKDHIKLHNARGIILGKDKLLRNRHKYFRGEN